MKTRLMSTAFRALFALAVVCVLLSGRPVRVQAAKAKWVQSNGKWKYRNASKNYVKSTFKKIGKYYYYFDSSGYVKTGWIKVDGSYYYGTKSKKSGECGRLKSGWTTAKKSGNLYYFSTTKKKGSYGKLSVGWKEIGKKVFYFKSNGMMATGWKTIDGNRYYFVKKGKNGSKGAMVTGLYKIGGKTYGFKDSGKIGEYGRLFRKEYGLTTGSGMDEAVCYFNSKGVLDEEKRSLSKQEFVYYIMDVAHDDMKTSKILASVTAAQAILESGYGQSRLALNGKNLFGIKASANGKGWKNTTWKGKIYTAKTSEYYNGKNVIITDDFRAYDSWAESVEDHSTYLTYATNGSSRRYKGVVGNKSPEKTIKIIKKGGYATDPDYVSSIMSIIKRYSLTKCDKKKYTYKSSIYKAEKKKAEEKKEETTTEN